MTPVIQSKKFAVGYDFQPNGGFQTMVEPYLHTIAEVYFPWPGIASGRDMSYLSKVENAKQLLLEDLVWCRQKGLGLDLLFNGNCYGEEAYCETLRIKVYDVLEELKSNGLFPETVTTTSEFIAKVIKVRYPEIDIRASVNMRIESTCAFEYIADIFDSLYICRDFQRDRKFLGQFSDWCATHGKKLCMLVNSACLRCCPVQIFHDNSLCHSNPKMQEMEFILHYPMRLCARMSTTPAFAEEILKMSWIRPEDIQYYAPYVSVMKLATRNTPNPEVMLKAYADGHWEGDLLEIIGIGNENFIIDNTAFPMDWVESGIAQNCAINCTNCGKCAAVLEQVKKVRQQIQPQYTLSRPAALTIQ